MDRNRFFSKGYDSGIDYSAISNMEQLHAARERLRNRIELKEYELDADVRAFKQAMNPVTYINRLVSKLYSFEYLAKYFMQGYEFVRNWFQGRDGNHSGSASAAEETYAGTSAPVGTGTGESTQVGAEG